MKLTPLADRVILKMVEVEETTKGGIILTASAKEKPSVAEVISVGPGGMVDGHDVVMTVKPGDKVITSKYAGTEVKLDDEEYVVVRQSDILAIVESRLAKREQAPPLDSPPPVCGLATPPKAAGSKYFCHAHVAAKMI